MLSASSAIASPILFAAAFASADERNTGGTLASVSTGVINGVDSAGPESATNIHGSAFAQVLNGVLGASADVSYTPGPLNFDSNSATGTALFTDTLTLQSTSLPVGTLVPIAFSLHLSDNLSPDFTMSGVQLGCSMAQSFFSATVLTGADAGAVIGTLDATDATCVGAVPGTRSGTFFAEIGDEVRVNVSLMAVAQARAGAMDISVDASHTLQFFADPLLDFTYTTASGNTFFTPPSVPAAVPEPATLPLLATGIVGAAMFWRRRMAVA
jgi:hypothetical protein